MNTKKEKICDISIIIPAYNEDYVLKKTLLTIVSYLENEHLDYEIIIIDDGSSDSTFEIAQSFASSNERIVSLRNTHNRGKGFSVRKGMLASSGRYVLFSDSDLSTPIDQINKLKEALEKNSAAIGSRALPESDIKLHQPKYREIMGRIFNSFVQLLTIPGIKDTQCGFKMFDGEIGRKLFALAKIDGFCFDVEVLYIAYKLGYTIAEVPVVWINDENTRVSPLTDASRMFLDLIRIRWIHRGIKRKSGEPEIREYGTNEE